MTVWAAGKKGVSNKESGDIGCVVLTSRMFLEEAF